MEEREDRHQRHRSRSRSPREHRSPDRKRSRRSPSPDRRRDDRDDRYKDERTDRRRDERDGRHRDDREEDRPRHDRSSKKSSHDRGEKKSHKRHHGDKEASSSRKRSKRSRRSPEKQIDLDSLVNAEEDMMKSMGFAGFDTTKNKKVEGNVEGMAKLNKPRKYRQYMNRKGGFNRPLDFIA